MLLKVADPKEIYSVLDKAYLLQKIPGIEMEEWKLKDETQNELENIRKTAGYELHSVELPHPLDGISMGFERNGVYYNARTLLSARNLKAYRGLSNRLEADFHELGLDFFPTTAYGTGHICDKTRKTVFSILESNQNTRTIGIGVYGAVPRRFEGFEKFNKDIGEFEKIINTYVINCLDPCFKLVSPSDKLTLYFS